MHQVYSHHDSSTVGLPDGLLREHGIPTLLKNWTGSNITEIPIPSLYPTIYVLDTNQVLEAKQLIEDYLKADTQDHPKWICPNCGEPVDGFLAECWACQTERPD